MAINGAPHAHEESARLKEQPAARQPIKHPNCLASNVYKSWHPSDVEKRVTPAACTAPRAHLPWFSRIKLLLSHRASVG